MARIKGFSFSEGNHKMGRVGSFSVMPGITCAHCEECYKDCYSRKMIAYRKPVLRPCRFTKKTTYTRKKGRTRDE